MTDHGPPRRPSSLKMENANIALRAGEGLFAEFTKTLAASPFLYGWQGLSEKDLAEVVERASRALSRLAMLRIGLELDLCVDRARGVPSAIPPKDGP